MTGGPAFHAELDTPLLRFGREPWCIRHAAEGTAIWGAPGSGKSSGSGQAAALAFLAAGMGGCVLCAKPGEADTWRRYAAETGRSSDVVVIDETAAECFNFLDYAAKTFAKPGFEQNLTHLMGRMHEASRVAGASSGGGGGDNQYFIDSSMMWCGHAFPMLLLAYGVIRLEDLAKLIDTIPASLEVVQDDKKYNAWVKDSFCGQTHLLAGARAERAKGHHRVRAMKLLEEHASFFMETVPQLSDKTRSVIQSTVLSMIYPFLSGKLRELFCSGTTVRPEDARDGKIIILDIPVLKFGTAGAVGQTLFKYLFGLAIQSEAVDESTRPVFIFADEAQFFLNSSDADLLSTARSSKTCIVFLTQDLPTYYAKLGSNARDVAESIISKFGTRIFHSNLSQETNQFAADQIGKIEKFHVSRAVAKTVNTGGGSNRHDGGGAYNGSDGKSVSDTQSQSGFLDYEIPPDYFAKELRNGTPANRFKVDGIVLRTSGNWKKTGKHWLKAEFNQRPQIKTLR